MMPVLSGLLLGISGSLIASIVVKVKVTYCVVEHGVAGMPN